MFFNFDEVEQWILIVSRYWRETSRLVGYVGSWKKRIAVVENDFQRMIFQSSKLLLLHIFNRFIPTLCGQSFLFWSKLQRCPYMGGVSVLGTCRKSQYYFVPQSFIQSNFSRQPVALSGDFVPLMPVSQTRCLAMLIPLNSFPSHSVTKEGELVPLELFSQTSFFIHLTSFWINLFRF